MELLQKPHTAGLRTTERAIKSGSCCVVYLAEDANIYVRRRIRDLCLEAGVECETVPTMAELGEACALPVKTACAAVLKG